ncbi:MAG: class I SAM-dependent methyltransferase [Microbacterium sp.]|uniref:class I SAM-dependent methyltransferase n=1 Tax=Microbacterium sp. TaxID=51671 RepID=UPI001D69BB3E|nr:class I SAM-dependent methyltransferase [Microbacterium sp.]MBW8761092.1 class I SAM-dependent methyltransferase [Microbacterium sp.]
MRNLVPEVIAAAAGRSGELTEIIRRFGYSAVAEALATEVAFRCGRSRSDAPVTAELRVVGEDAVKSYWLWFHAGEPVRLIAEPDTPAAMIIEFDVVDLAKQLYGIRRTEGTAACRIDVAIAPPGADAAVAMQNSLSTSLAAERLISACSGTVPNLGELSVEYDSDKSGGLHWFTQHYERHFRELRDEAVRVLEIGVGGYGYERYGGGSLRMWKRYFHRGLICGLDIFDKSQFDEARITTIIGDQSAPDTLRAISDEYGPFDVVIDDGSHVNEHVMTSFRMLFPLLSPGGVYVIEDLWTAYQPSYGGQAVPDSGANTSLGMLKSLVDSIHHLDRPGVADEFGPMLTGMHVYHNIAFLEKGRNFEGMIPSWVADMKGSSVQSSTGGLPGFRRDARA